MVHYRRKFLIHTLSCALVGYFGTSIRAAAQDRDTADLAKLIENNVREASHLLEFVLTKDLSNRENVDYIVEEDYRLRSELVVNLYGLSPSVQAELIDIRYSKAALLMAMQDVAVTPEEITRADFDALSVSAEQHPCDRLTATLFIILDAVGLWEEREVVVALIRDTPIQGMLEELVAGYPDRSWEDTARQITDLALVIVGAEFCARIAIAVGRQALGRMLDRFSLSFVPYTGVIYITIVIAASVRKNWNLIYCD